MGQVMDATVKDVKDRLLKANHNYIAAIGKARQDVKDRLLKANHNFVARRALFMKMSKIVC